MPVHDWSRVEVGVFHDFHHSWIEEIKRALNRGRLPPDCYAMAEQYASEYGPDVLTLQRTDPGAIDLPGVEAFDSTGTLAVAVAPPQVRYTSSVEMNYYLSKQKSVVIRHVSGDRVIALIEVVSPGNKASQRKLELFVRKAAEVLQRGCHLLVLDLLPPGSRDPNGIHGAIWEEVGDDSYHAPGDKPLTLAGYAADLVTTAYVEPIAVGDVLPEMPLFLKPDAYINVPLESTYQSAFDALAERWQQVLEA